MAKPKPLTETRRLTLDLTGDPTSVRFTEVDRPEDGEPALVGMVIVPADAWRRAGAPFALDITLAPVEE